MVRLRNNRSACRALPRSQSCHASTSSRPESAATGIKTSAPEAQITPNSNARAHIAVAVSDLERAAIIDTDNEPDTEGEPSAPALAIAKACTVLSTLVNERLSSN